MAIGRFGSGDEELESLRDQFYEDRPIGMGRSFAHDEWEAMESKYHRLKEDGQDTSELTVDELRRITDE